MRMKNFNLKLTRGIAMINLRLGKLLYSTTVCKSTDALVGLNSAQSAFIHRLNLQSISPVKLILAFSHPQLSKPSSTVEGTSSLEEFEHLCMIGNYSLHYFTKEYLNSRFPSLSGEYLRIGIDVFLAHRNLLNFARFLGIDAACGFDLLDKTNSIVNKTGNLKNSKYRLRTEVKSLDHDKKTLQLDCFKALLGTIGLEAGPLSLRTLLDSRYFNNSQFDPRDFIRPLYPIPDLSLKYPDLVFRLHQESGRLSNSPMFIIGVYSDSASKTCLGEGFGASQALAQHRAATEALRNMNLVEKRVSIRPSDKMTSIKDIMSTIN